MELVAFDISENRAILPAIAFSKIEGLEVTPARPSSSTSFLRSPLAMKSRARKSSHTACPYSCKDATVLGTDLPLSSKLLFARAFMEVFL
jgi:hypothetical protein